MSPLPPPESTVFVVEDDAGVALSLRSLIESVGLRVALFANAQAFLGAYDPRMPGCLVLDVRMPGMSGLQLQEHLAARRIPIPIVFITGHGDVRMAVRAVQAGAIDFLEKPFHDQDLLDKIQLGLARDAQWRRGADAHAAIQQRIDSLTPRESEVLDLLVKGRSTKQIADTLALSCKTVEFHRGRLMEKMHTRTVQELMGLLLEDCQATVRRRAG
jgi:FixJ family two-component response regulator